MFCDFSDIPPLTMYLYIGEDFSNTAHKQLARILQIRLRILSRASQPLERFVQNGDDTLLLFDGRKRNGNLIDYTEL